MFFLLRILSLLADGKQMMGPEAMGIKQQNYEWWDEKICRNFLFGTCPHLVFGNTVCPDIFIH